MGHPHNTLYTPTCFYYNVYNTQSAILVISVTISVISIMISVISIIISIIPVAISTMSAIFVIFIILKIFVIPTPSTC